TTSRSSTTAPAATPASTTSPRWSSKGGNWPNRKPPVLSSYLSIKTGEDHGFAYKGKPITPGFHQVRQPSTALSVVLALSDGQVAYADGVGVYYSGRMNRDPLFVPAEQVSVFDAQVRPLLEGARLDAFRPLAKRIDELPIHKAMKYGVSMAVLDAVAKARHVTMSEVIADEYGLELIAQPLVLNHQVGPDWYVGVEKIILRRG